MLELENPIHPDEEQQGFLPPPTYFPPPGGDSGEDDDELTVLPRHTKVVVRGNNRTKSVLVGLQGVVKKAVGLGGWHWLVLTNGVEVKLQRNALTVIEPPTGQEEDDEIEIPFSNDNSLDDFPRTFKPRVRPQKPSKTITDTHIHHHHHHHHHQEEQYKPQPQPQPREHKKPIEQPMAPPEPPPFPAVDLSKLETSALRRYRKHFKLSDVGRNSSKEQLLRAIEKHFIAHQLDEVEVITGFLQSAKRLKTC